MPQLWKNPDLRPADYFSSYQATYLERDVRQAVEPFLHTARLPAMVLCRTGESYPVGRDMLAVHGLSMRADL